MKWKWTLLADDVEVDKHAEHQPARQDSDTGSNDAHRTVDAWGEHTQTNISVGNKCYNIL